MSEFRLNFQEKSHLFSNYLVKISKDSYFIFKENSNISVSFPYGKYKKNSVCGGFQNSHTYLTI